MDKVVKGVLVVLAMVSLPVVLIAAATGSDIVLWAGVGILAIVTIFHKRWCSINK